MKFKGAIRNISPVTSGTSSSGKEWTKQQISVEEINTEHPNSLVFEALNKPLEGLAVGIIVDVEYNAKVNEYNGKLYNSLLIYKIEKVKAPKTSVERDYGINPPNPIDDISEPADDLPF